VIVVVMESVAMSGHRADTSEQGFKFVPKEWPNSYGAQVEEVGQAIITKIQRAADSSNENCDRALALAHKLSMQLRTAEDRISQLEAEVELFRDRAVRAERWLQTIQNEIEEKLIAPRSANAAEQTPLPKDAEQRQVLKTKADNLPTRCQLESPTTTTSAPSRSVGRSAIEIWKELEECAQNLPK
jgi:chromosome segregation ATPase